MQDNSIMQDLSIAALYYAGPQHRVFYTRPIAIGVGGLTHKYWGSFGDRFAAFCDDLGRFAAFCINLIDAFCCVLH